MKLPLFIAIFIILSGLSAIAIGIFNWKWFFRNYYVARYLARILGDRGARIFYIIFGLVWIAIGLIFAFNL
jgi:small neutral amino acid transporter SnatA (MarC family)